MQWIQKYVRNGNFTLGFLGQIKKRQKKAKKGFTKKSYNGWAELAVLNSKL